MGRVAVLVLNYNGKRYLKACFDSLLKQDFKDFDIYLVDNNSSDGSVEFVKENFPQVKIIRFNKNLGFAEAYNRAISMVDAEYVVLLNNDVVVDKNWLRMLYNEISKHDDVFSVSSKIIIMNKDRLHYAGAYILPSGGGVERGFFDRLRKIYDRPMETAAACGASMIVRRDLFLKLKFDSDFFAYFEDLDLSWRAWKYGYRILYNPRSFLYHHLGGYWGLYDNPLKIYLITRNRIYTLIKNRDGKLNIIKGIILSLIIDFLRFIIFLRTRRYNILAIIKAIVRAYISVLLNLKHLLIKRKIVMKNERISDKLLEKKGFILSTTDLLYLGIRFMREVLTEKKRK